MQPNRAHEIVAELEQRGLVRGVITQNIDRLHRAAGRRTSSRYTGRSSGACARSAAGSFELDQVDGDDRRTDPAARPSACACIAPLKPDVVLFGEMLPEDAMFEAHGWPPRPT